MIIKYSKEALISISGTGNFIDKTNTMRIQIMINMTLDNIRAGIWKGLYREEEIALKYFHVWHKKNNYRLYTRDFKGISIFYQNGGQEGFYIDAKAIYKDDYSIIKSTHTESLFCGVTRSERRDEAILINHTLSNILKTQ